MRSTIEMAREAGWTSYDSQDERFKTLVTLARADEREACAKVCDEVDKESQSQWPKRLATMIRARGEI